MTIVGVVADAKNARSLLKRDRKMYVPMRQHGASISNLGCAVV